MPILEARLEQGQWVFECEGRRLVVEPGVGARVVEFSLDGRDILVGPGVNPLNYGSTFWTSPQSAWGWPPPEEIDSQPYEVVRDGSGPRFVGPTSPELGLGVSKRVAAAPAAGFVLTYSIQNRGQVARRVAPWEITRVPGGLSYFPLGDGRYPLGPTPSLDVTDELGVTWFDHSRARIDRDRKLFAHGARGWLAHAADGLLLVKAFDSIEPHQQAPEEAQIELFANWDGKYVEIEEQGAYTELLPGAHVDFSVTWRMISLPAGLAIRAGNEELVALAELLARGSAA